MKLRALQICLRLNKCEKRGKTRYEKEKENIPIFSKVVICGDYDCFFSNHGMPLGDSDKTPAGEVFIETVYGDPCYCMYQISEGYLVLAVMPTGEAALSRNVSVGATTAMQILVFAALFALIFFLVRRLVVDNIYKVNESLSAISEGRLDTTVNVRSHQHSALPSVFPPYPNRKEFDIWAGMYTAKEVGGDF